MAKIILFVDAMEPTEYGDGWTDTERGLVESGYPKVTPKVTSEVYTGLSPSENGMGGTHAAAEIPTTRPMVPTIQEKLEAAGYNVGSFMMPYCMPLQLQNGAWVSTAMGQVDAGPNPIAQRMMQPPTAGDLKEDEEEVTLGFNTRREDIYARSSALLNAIRILELDVAFLAIRSPDEFTHFAWHSGYREKLLEALAHEVGRWEQNHDVLWWSDHGSEEKKETFRVNKWLQDKGYLNLDVDVEFNERFKEEMPQQQEQQQQDEIENQLAVQSPGVSIEDGSVAMCVDAYDSCITMIGDYDENTREELIKEMESTGYYKGVGKTEDIWGEGQYLEHCPDIVTLREDHVLVTGNVHPEPIGMGFYRSGVHSAYGAWGTTDTAFEYEGDVTPQELHGVIWKFVTGEPTPDEQALEQVDRMKEQMERQLQQMQDVQTPEGG